MRSASSWLRVTQLKIGEAQRLPQTATYAHLAPTRRLQSLPALAKWALHAVRVQPYVLSDGLAEMLAAASVVREEMHCTSSSTAGYACENQQRSVERVHQAEARKTGLLPIVLEPTFIAVRARSPQLQLGNMRPHWCSWKAIYPMLLGLTPSFRASGLRSRLGPVGVPEAPPHDC